MLPLSDLSYLAVICGETPLHAFQLPFPPIVGAVRLLDNPNPIAFFEYQIPLTLACKLI